MALHFSTHSHRASHGYFVIMVLVFGAIFLIMVTALAGLIVTQKRVSSRAVNNEQALQIAEAGLDYYRWYLAHNPGDITDGTAGPPPYVHEYEDPEGGTVGEFALTLTSSAICGETHAINITSEGSTVAEPGIIRTVFGRYSRPTVSQYAYIINSNVWAGADRVIVGPYHSNGGIRMDGTNNSIVSSGVATWFCTGSFGCSPNQNQNGVFGAGPNSSLWRFPAPPVSFVGLSVDLAGMQDKAQNAGGVYVGPSGASGYRLVFRNNNTFDLHRVTNTTQYWGYTTENGWQTERHRISNTTFLANYAIPAGCPVIFVEDKVWLEGVVSTKVTLAVADVDTPGINPSIILNNNITYSVSTAGLLAIGEQDVLVGLEVPTNMTLNGIFIAQNGRFGRNHYVQSGTYGLPSSLDPYVTRNSLTVNGTIVSNGREGTKWTSNGNFVSGFATRNNSYDRNLVVDPPPLTPYVSDDYTFIEWREMEE